MEFMLIWDWLGSEDNTGIEVDFFETKEEVLEAKKDIEEVYPEEIKNGLLLLSPAIGYSWADFERLF